MWLPAQIHRSDPHTGKKADQNPGCEAARQRCGTADAQYTAPGRSIYLPVPSAPKPAGKVPGVPPARSSAQRPTIPASHPVQRLFPRFPSAHSKCIGWSAVAHLPARTPAGKQKTLPASLPPSGSPHWHESSVSWKLRLLHLRPADLAEPALCHPAGRWEWTISY